MNPVIIGAAFAAGFVCGVVTAHLWRRARRDLEAERSEEDPAPKPPANATSGNLQQEKRGKRLLRELW